MCLYYNVSIPVAERFNITVGAYVEGRIIFTFLKPATALNSMHTSNATNGLWI